MIPDTEPGRKRELSMTAAYICGTYVYYLHGYKGFWFDCQQLIDRIHIGKYDRWEPHMNVSVMGRFKGEDRDCMHLLPLVKVTHSGIRIWVWL